MPTILRLVSSSDLPPAPVFALAGRADALTSDAALAALPPGVDQAVWLRMVKGTKAGELGSSASTWLDGDVEQIVAVVLPGPGSRHNAPARPEALTSLLRKGLPSGRDANIVVALSDPAHAAASAAAVARAFPTWRQKAESDDRSVRVALLGTGASPADLNSLMDAVRFAGELVDRPTSSLDVEAFVVEAERVAAEVGASIRVLRGEALRDGGFGGLWGVGKAATVGPALVVLSHEPEGATSATAWVGKGIVYDTGGLSIKGKSNMPGMKADMGGAAAVLGAFGAAVRRGTEQALHAVLCLAENAVGPDSVRPDDVIKLYSGRTVEVNNTDAEGRIVLGDGVAFASRELAVDVIIDLATLTGAQLVATGKRHAAILCNDEGLENEAVAAGKLSGDLVHPLVWAPEFHRKEFLSEVADMKNSVKDRGNAQCSCAAWFVFEHLDKAWGGRWLHVDLAGPSTADDRGTGFGVALLLELL
jgi:probable aminopeptidase NPEPL1